MKELHLEPKTGADLLAAARVANSLPLAQTRFWQEFLARLDQIDEAKRPKVEKRELTEG